MPLLSRLAVQAARAYGILSSRSTNISADYLVVAGGGGGAAGGGGGGAGGLLTSTFTLSTLNTYSITVGAGGLGGLAGGTGQGSNGSNSVVSGTGLTTVTSIGGGGTLTAGGVGNSGGSGGGGGSNDFGANSAGGAGTAGQGNNGGASFSTAKRGAGGGGGAGAVGSTGTNTAGGNGGNGLSSSISGSSVTYAGGGGGGSYSPNATIGGTGGTGGGGAGTGNGTTNATAGTANLGGGGGGGGATSGVGYGNGGNGGSGIVIISYTSATPKFVGGTITTSGGKQIHTFTSSGTLSPITPITASYLVVAGGGGSARQLGGYAGNGGGGAGGLLSGSTTIYSGATYVVTVGAGGAGGTTSGVAPSGSNSVLSGTGLTTLTSTGGGGGGGSTGPGANGGSGGGGSGEGTRAGGTGTSGQGNNGGNGVNAGGGGGGSGAAGANAVTTTGGAGGIGTQSSISGTATYYAGGGGGGAYSSGTAGTGGSGGGGNGGAGTSNTGNTPGTANTGGGAGGTAGDPATAVNGQTGGSGIVIISYAGSQQFNGGLVTTSGGNTIHTFTSTGALTPLTNNLNNSLRFRRSVTASLTRTPTVAGNRRTFTWSAWVKRGVLDSHQFLLSAATSTAFCAVDLLSNNMRVNFGNGTYLLVTTQVFRDPSAWYHIVLAVDTTQATDANRVRLFVNGNQVTAFSTAVYPIQNYDTAYNNTVAQRIGVNDASDSFDGYMTDINFIDGQALEPYYFGNNDANGVWKPIQYKGTYGTNGFYLTFGNTTSTTTLGYDSSPNGNNWTCNNISLTAGTTYDAMTDSPTNTSATVANYCTANPLRNHANNVITNGNLNIAFNDGTSSRTTFSTFGVTSGKWYWEMTVTTIGITYYPSTGVNTNLSLLPSDQSGSDAAGYMYVANGQKLNNGTLASYGSSYTTNDVIGVALDMDAGTITFYKNNTSQGQAYSGITGTAVPCFIGANGACAVNFGQRPFAYTPPTGYLALNTFNLPNPTILQGNKYMDATLWAGNSATGTVIVNQAQFKPDFVWVKNRTNSVGGFHNVFDSVRGIHKRLFTNDTQAEDTNSDTLQAFNSNGFTVGTNANVNASASNYVGWQWQAGQGSTSSNTDGSITSTVSVNTTAGFSVITWSGNSTAGATIGHGLGVAPKMFIVKNRTNAEGWVVYHTSIGATNFLQLNTTGASTSSAFPWNNTAPTSTLITLGSGTGTNGSGYTYVGYAWAEIAGFSSFGSATGNGSADGVFVYTGFIPKFILWKKSSGVGDWRIWDTSRSTYNAAQKILYPNGSDAEYDPNNGTTNIDILSNGFKLRSSNLNESAATYIYAAFAENPFKNSNAR